ncbi:MAG TPA: hypothetical protein VHD32_13925 [Candidatus Didemnitutus sp.]|nr:hypothetical protein [Candidatus Didemnitutus sp.]
MKKSAALPLLLAVAGLVAAPAPKPADASQRLRQHIDSLLLHRNKPEPLPVVLPNPFAVVTGGAMRPDGADSDDGEPVAVDASGKTAEAAPVDTNAEALAKCIAKLRFGGMVTVKGALQIIINDVPRKEGDVIVLDRNNAMTYLHVVHIAKNELTLSLNDATQTVRF